MKGFTKSEKELLLSICKNAKKSGKPLTFAFSECARKTGRNSGSVRNYYYRVLAKQSRLNLPPVKKVQKFSRAEEVALLRAVLSARLKFGSTRKAITYLAGGNSQLALRYQNKFSALLTKQRALVMRETLLQKQKEGKCFNPYKERLAREKAKLKSAAQ